MLKFARYLVLGLLVGAAVAPQAFAQRHPMPGSKTEPQVICSSCPGTNAAGQNNDGLPTYPYTGVLVDHVGRYVDSSNTGSFQNLGYRTARARFIRPAPDRRGSAPGRVYIQIGNGVAAYTMDTFFNTRLAAGMVPISNFVSGIMGFPRTPPESVLKWDALIYPEGPTSNWQPTGQDIQDPMGKGSPIDFDDRGYVYSAHTIHGWGIVSDNGKTDASQLTKVMQWIAGPKPGYANVKADTSGVSPDSVVALKLSASQYRALVADRSGSWAIYDVSGETASAWRMLSKSSEFNAKYGIRKAERDETNKRLAYIDGAHKLRIYEYSSIVDGGAPIVEYLDNTGFAEIAFDESSNLWAAEKNGTIWKLTKSGNGYTTTKYSPFPGRFEPLLMHAAAGYMVVGGIDYTLGTYDVHIFRIEASGLKLMDVDNFFRKYYHQAPAGYATPPAYTAIAGQSADVKIVKHGGETYLMYSGFGIGDVFKLEAGNAINITVKNTYGTPNAKAPAGGPFYGDLVTFNATSSSSNVAYDVNWVFGNPEVGSTNNSGKSRTGEDEMHQYGGLTTAALITQPKLVRAQTIQDPNIQAQLNLSLKLPTPRVGATSLATALDASTSGLEFVAGERFHDASDGSVESHYGVWTLDGNVPEKLNPTGTPAVGGIGPHTMQFQAKYGPYDASFNNATPYDAPALTIGYTVKPFKVTLDTPVASGANVIFSAAPRVTQEAGIITAPTWTVNWTLNGAPYPAAAAGGVGTNAAQSAPVGTIPPVSIPKTLLSDGSIVGLTVTIDPTGLSAPAQQYNVASASTTLSTPDPEIQVTGCANAGSACTFTAKSVGNKSQAGWTYLWTLTRPGGLGPLTATTATFSPTISVGGPYVITLKTTKTIFEATVDKNLSVGASLCGALPASHNVSITASCTTNCAAGSAITFVPSFLGYSRQSCDQYLWSFGDGSQATTEEASHAYASQGTFTVTLTISNSGTTTPVVKTRQITVGGGTVDPGTGCTAPPAAVITYSGTPSSCSTGGACRTTDNITFSARRGTQGLQTCDAVLWEFPDGSTSTQRQPSKSFPTAGTYAVKLTISNTNGNATTTQNVVVNAPPVGNCNTAPQPANFVITYVGQQSNCSETNGAGCSSGEGVRFEALNYFYTVGSCDNFEWDFGDGTKSTERTPTHIFAGSQTTYAVKLKVANTAGQYIYSRNVPFANSAPTKPVPTITYSVFPTTGRKGQAVTFTATSSLATTTGWSWNFGDGTAANISQSSQTKQTSTITYTFTKSGTFTVRATARNSEDSATAPTNTAQANIVVTDPPAIPEYKFLIPDAAYLSAGDDGSTWRTDVQIYSSDPNLGNGTPLEMTVTFNGQNYPLSQSKKTHIYENFINALLSRQDRGAVIITTKNTTTPPQIWTRTYVQTSAGTFGQFIPAIRIDNIGGAGAVDPTLYYMAGLRQDSRYRTNVGFLNPNATAITATVTVYDADKFKIGEFPLTLNPFQIQPFLLASKVPNLPTDEPFSVKIDVPTGMWIVAYASFIDGWSKDAVYIQALPENAVASADYKTTVLPGVGHTGQWRSDVTIFNPDADGVMFDIEYFNSAGEKKAQALNVPLDSGKFLEYGDILKQGVLGNVEDGLGTLKLTVKDDHERYPMTFARTYFDNGPSGTYGQGIPGFSPARANVKPNQHAIIAGVRNSAAYRTNIGLVNVSNAPVTVTVTLLDPNTGGAVAAIPYTLQPNQTIVGNFNGWGALEQGTFKIEANGAVWAFCSIIDQLTKDTEYVPATPILAQ